MSTQGKKTIGVKEMCRISGLDENYVKSLMEFGYIEPGMYTEVEVNIGTGSKEGDQELHRKICQAKVEGKPWPKEAFATRMKSAEERFTEICASPRGLKRWLDPRIRQEIVNRSVKMPHFMTKEELKKGQIDDNS